MADDYSDLTSPQWSSNDSEAQPYTEPYASLPYMETPTPSADEPSMPSAKPSAPQSEEARLAAAYQMGKVLGHYKGGDIASPDVPSIIFNNRFFLRLVMLSLLFLLFTLGSWIYYKTPPWPLLAVLGFILLLILGSTISSLPRAIRVGLQQTEFYLCANGLMIITWGKVQAIHWEQIQAVQRFRKSGITSHVLYLENGEPVKLDGTLVGPRSAMLGRAIERAISQRLLPDAITAHEAGQVVNFGAIDVTPEGFRLEKGHDLLPWERFVTLEICNGYLTIKENTRIAASLTNAIKEQQGFIGVRNDATTSTWADIEEHDMLNLCVFLPLINHIRRTLRALAQKSEEENALNDQPVGPPPEWSEYE
ncbi:MAG TPA: DUF6585 family protein [Ktedonosporobacter sp.]|nr:DUF6585 family protein [Ktedonosporobacter sp.]